MMRQAIVLAVAALALVPDWAGAFGRRRAAAVPVARPVCPPRVVWVSPCLPTFPVAPPPVAMHIATPPAAPPRLGPPSVKAEVEPAKPAPAKPELAKPEPAKPDPLPDPKPSLTPLPLIPKPNLLDVSPPGAAAPAAPPVLPAKAEAIPPPRVPTEPVAVPVAVPVVAVPTVAAPEPAKFDGVKLPPLAVPLPKPPAAEPTTRVAQSSPLSGPPVVELYPVDGKLTLGPRTVVFFNHTDRDVTVTVEGRSAVLPKRHHLFASVPAKFAWKLDDGEERKTEVPAAAPGLDVVIRK